MPQTQRKGIRKQEEQAMERWRVLAAVVFWAIGESALATPYFVSMNGNDAAAGTSNAPWRTLQHAANVVSAGDLVTVRPGNYTGFQLETSGTVAAPIEFFAEPGVLINAANPVRGQHGINLENASHVIVDGFAVTGMPQAGVRSVGVDGNELASFVTIRNVNSYNNGKWGILTGFVNDLVIENNFTSGSAIEHGIYVSNSGDRPTIRNNMSFNNRANGIHMNGDIEQETGDGIISGALVSGNIIYNNGTGGGSGINMDGVQNSRIENNLLYNNHHSGISLYKFDGGGASIGNVVINNTIHQAANGLWALNIQDGSTGNTALNNVLVSDSGSRGAIDISADSLIGFTSDYNVVMSRFTTNGGDSNHTLEQWQVATGQDSHSKAATTASELAALFADPAGVDRDYHLISTSLAVNAGSSLLAPAFDLDGKNRPIGGAWDIGAYESGAVAIPGDYNGNGSVDASDYALWRNTFGQTVAAGVGADGNNSGLIDDGDYTVWKSHFGQSAGAAAKVTLAPIPEPSAGWLAVIAAMGGIACGSLNRR